MALLQTNKDLISTGMKEFNVLLNQQVSPGPMFQRTCLEDWGAVGEGREEIIIWSWERNGGADGNS